MAVKPVILVVDDKEDVCLSLINLLKKSYIVHSAQSVEKGIARLERSVEMGRPYDVALIDMRFDNFEPPSHRGRAGMLVLKAALKVSFLEAIVMTAFGEIGCAVEAMREGAFTYLEKGRSGTVPQDLRNANTTGHRASFIAPARQLCRYGN